MGWSRRSFPSSGLQTTFVPEPQRVVRGRPWHILVGTMPDEMDVAKQGGVAPSNVHLFRKKMGIPVFQREKVA